MYGVNITGISGYVRGERGYYYFGRKKNLCLMALNVVQLYSD